MRPTLFHLFTLTLLVLSGCDSSEGHIDDRGDLLPSVAFALPGLAHATRAGAAEPLGEGATVRIVAYKAGVYVSEKAYVVGSGGGLTACTVDAKGVYTGADPNPVYLMDVGTYDFYAVSPALTVNHTANPPKAGVEHGMDYAVSVTPGVSVVSAANQIVTLAVLDRKCSKLEFTIDRLSANITRVDIMEVALTQLKTSPHTLNLGADIDLSSGYTASGLVVPQGAFTTDPGATTASGSAIVMPRDHTKAGDISLTMKVRFNGIANVLTLGPIALKNLSLLKACQYSFRITVRAGHLELVISAADWAGNGPGEGDAEEFVVGSGPIACDYWEFAHSSSLAGGPIYCSSWSPKSHATTVGTGPAGSDWDSNTWNTNIGTN